MLWLAVQAFHSHIDIRKRSSCFENDHAFEFLHKRWLSFQALAIFDSLLPD